MRHDDASSRLTDRIRYEHMLQAALDVVHICDGRGRDEFATNIMFSRAIVNAIQEIGEAAARITDEGRKFLPALPWGSVVRTRHIIVHDYHGIDLDIVWRIATVEVPQLVPQLRQAIAAMPSR